MKINPPSLAAAADDAAVNEPPLSSVARRRALSLALAMVGIAILARAQTTTWVRVTGGANAWLFPQDATVRTYRLAALAGAAVPLYTGWVVLFGLLVAAWVGPDRARGLSRLAGVLVGVLVFLTFVSGESATRLGGWGDGDHPDASIESGAVFALLGAFLLAMAVAALAKPRRISEDPIAPSEPPDAVEPAAVEPSAVEPDAAGLPTAEPAGVASTGPAGGAEPLGWSARPVWVPWWRRGGPLTALGIGAVALSLLTGAVAWAVLHRVRPRDHSGDLREFLVSAPEGATPRRFPIGTDGQLDLDQAAQLSANPKNWIELLRSGGFRRGALGGWTGADGTGTLVELMQFDSERSAGAFLLLYQLVERKGVGDANVADIPNLSEGNTFVSPKPDGNGMVRVEAVARCRDVVFLVLTARPSPPELGDINILARRQYDQL